MKAKIYIIIFFMLLVVLFDPDSQLKADSIYISRFYASNGTSTEHIDLVWNCLQTNVQFILYRSNTAEGVYKKIAKIDNVTRFVDTNVEPGYKYWYKLIARSGVNYTKPLFTVGYRKIEAPKGLTYDQFIKMRNRSKPRPAGSHQKETWKKHIRELEDYYESYITMSLIIYVGKKYIENKKLTVYHDFSHYNWQHANKTLFINQKNIYLKFYSKRLYRLVRRYQKKGIQPDEILPRLVKNAVFYCVDRGEYVQRFKNGRIKMVPYFEAIGMSTEYYKNYKKWRSNTVVLASDTKDLKKLIQDNK